MLTREGKILASLNWTEKASPPKILEKGSSVPKNSRKISSGLRNWKWKCPWWPPMPAKSSSEKPPCPWTPSFPYMLYTSRFFSAITERTTSDADISVVLPASADVYLSTHSICYHWITQCTPPASAAVHLSTHSNHYHGITERTPPAIADMYTSTYSNCNHWLTQCTPSASAYTCIYL